MEIYAKKPSNKGGQNRDINGVDIGYQWRYAVESGGSRQVHGGLDRVLVVKWWKGGVSVRIWGSAGLLTKERGSRWGNWQKVGGAMEI